MTTWLPALVLLSHHNGVWDTYLEDLYEHFTRDFISSQPIFRGARLGLKRFPVSAGKVCTFWHFISEGKDEASRVIDHFRCERIRWPKPIIDEETTQGLPVWWEERNRERRIVIALPDFSYVVVLAERRTQTGLMYLPWTAYQVEQEHRRKRHRRIWEKNHL